MIRYPSNGSQTTSSANGTSNNNSGSNNDTIIITYDHLGNHLWIDQSNKKLFIKRVLVAWKNYDRILQWNVFHINTGSRIFIERNWSKHEQIHCAACSTETDNHADTHCFGSNIWPLLFTSEEFVVSPFLEDYSEQVNIQICTGETSYTMELGEVMKLIFVQGLWFRKSTEKNY